MSFEIRCRSARFDGTRTFVMGVLNVTPDSFSDGGRFLAPVDAAVRGRALLADGADILDVGGESTRPGAEPVSATDEWARIAPVLEGLRGIALPISVDTYKAEVAERALGAGAEIINDISGGSLDPDIVDVCGRAGAVMVLSHLRGAPRTMQDRISFGDVYAEVCDELAAVIERARAAGVVGVIADPGIGFGKTVEQNLELLGRSGEMAARLGVPVLVGPSRKGFLGTITGLPVDERGAASLGAVVAAADAGAAFVRVHDVADARRALAVADAIRRATRGAHSTRDGGRTGP